MNYGPHEDNITTLIEKAVTLTREQVAAIGNAANDMPYTEEQTRSMVKELEAATDTTPWLTTKNRNELFIHAHDAVAEALDDMYREDLGYLALLATAAITAAAETLHAWDQLTQTTRHALIAPLIPTLGTDWVP